MKSKATLLVEAILEEKDDISHTLLFLAAQCGADAYGAISDEVKAGIRKRLISVMHEPHRDPTLREKIIACIAYWGDADPLFLETWIEAEVPNSINARGLKAIRNVQVVLFKLLKPSMWIPSVGTAIGIIAITLLSMGLISGLGSRNNKEHDPAPRPETKQNTEYPFSPFIQPRAFAFDNDDIRADVRWDRLDSGDLTIQLTNKKESHPDGWGGGCIQSATVMDLTIFSGFGFRLESTAEVGLDVKIEKTNNKYQAYLADARQDRIGRGQKDIKLGFNNLTQSDQDILSEARRVCFAVPSDGWPSGRKSVTLKISQFQFF